MNIDRKAFCAFTSILRDVLDDATLVFKPSTSPRHVPAWDSGKMVMLILAVEDRFKLTLTSKEIERLRTVGDWVRLIEARGVRG